MSKRKHTTLTLSEKLKVVELRDKGWSYTKLSAEFGIGKSTVHDIVKQKDKLQTFVAEQERDGGSTRRKKMWKADDEVLDRSVYLWFTQARAQGSPVSGPLIQEKAKMLHKSLYPEASEDTFKASHGWLQKFKSRHGIRELRLQGESLSADLSSVEPFKSKLQELVEENQLSLHQIFNCDETGLYWRLLPGKTLAPAQEKTARNFKKSKDRVTILSAANASGDFRLPLLLIGKSMNPRCLKNVNRSALPVIYTSQSKAWMNSTIFMAWFFEHFIPKVKIYLREKGLPPKALLLLDNAPSHPSCSSLQSPDGSIKCVFLPANTTSILQPMDQGILENLKRRYKRALLERLLLSLESEGPQEFIKSLNIRDCIYMCAKAWEDIRSQSLARAWNKLLASTSNDPPNAVNNTEILESTDDAQPELDIASELSLTHDEIQEWFENDKNACEELTDEEIVQMAQSDQVESDSSDDELDIARVFHSVALAAFDTCIQYLEQQPDSSSIQIMLLYKLRASTAEKRAESLKRTDITDFLHQYSHLSYICMYS